MRSIARVALLCPVLLLLVPSAPAAGKLRPIRGKLSANGYDVVALAANGKARVTRARRFTLRPPAEKVTLQLRGRDGNYAGPIVVAVDGRRVIEGVRAGARLGEIEVRKRKGYARSARRLAAKWLDAARWARARKRVPIGNGRNVGFVRSRPPRAAPPGDRDADGVPDPLDVAPGGRLVLGDLDRAAAARAAQIGAPGMPGVHSNLSLRLEDTVNANAATLSTADIDAALATHASLGLSFPQNGSTELDCGDDPGLSYCTTGGTGHWFYSGAPGAPPPAFPGCCDPDSDGFGTLARSAGLDYFYLGPGARSDQIGTGDEFIERVTQGGVETQFPLALQFVFNTVPALVSYSDTAGNSATVAYPVDAGDPGTAGNGFPVSAPPGEHVELTFALWRPQRAPIPPDANGLGGDACLKDDPACEWIDIGRLFYAVPHILRTAVFPQSVGATDGCPQSAYSTTDPNLSPASLPFPMIGFEDSAPDRPASAANTLTYTLDVTECLASYGLTWEQDDELVFVFKANAIVNGQAEQFVAFTRQ